MFRRRSVQNFFGDQSDKMMRFDGLRVVAPEVPSVPSEPWAAEY